jgi:hypothetical protein
MDNKGTKDIGRIIMKRSMDVMKEDEEIGTGLE